MAAVIAHEVKNPLAAVRGAIQVIGNRLPAGSREVGVVTDIIARIDTLNQLVKDLLLFARPPQPHLLPLDVSLVLEATAALLKQDAAHAGMHVTITGQAPPVMADAELLKIVFINLFVNSSQAMKRARRGRVTVAAVDEPVIVVTDTGPGIASPRASGFHAFLHHEIAGNRAGAFDGEASARGASRQYRTGLAGNRRHAGHHPAAACESVTPRWPAY
jgi:signal transduction histidine kinase